jgi:hypothetical protein
MRTLSGPHTTAAGAAVTRPAVLVQIDFGTVRRWSSMATVSWSSQTWTAYDVRVENLVVEALRISGTLVVGNQDDVIGGLVLSEGIQDRAITIYGYDAAATASGDVQWLASAVGASAQIEADEVRIALRHKCEFTASPRTYVNQAANFTQVMAAGSVLKINGIDYRLGR